MEYLYFSYIYISGPHPSVLIAERELYSLLGRLGQLYVFILGFFTLHENYKEDVTDLQLFKEFSSCCCIFENKTVMKELGNGGILDLRFNLRIFCF